MAPDKRTGPQDTPEARPNAESPPTATGAAMVTDGRNAHPLPWWDGLDATGLLDCGSDGVDAG
jgi:hypothetical protein